nr:hypothetical protein [Sporomusa silvacetica]
MTDNKFVWILAFPELNDYTPKGHRLLPPATRPDGASADCAMDGIAIRPS